MALVYDDKIEELNRDFGVVNHRQRLFGLPGPLGGVFLLSFAAGGALAFALNQMNPVFFTGAKLRQVIDYPVIGSITMILPPDVVARRRTEAAAWSTVLVLLVVSTGAVVALAPSAGPLIRRMLEGVGA